MSTELFYRQSLSFSPVISHSHHQELQDTNGLPKTDTQHGNEITQDINTKLRQWWKKLGPESTDYATDANSGLE